MKTCLPLAVILGLLLAAGCASTPESRIHRNQEFFDTLPVADQARIRGGRIDLGYSPDMVRIALGDPQRRLARRDPAGPSEVWLYLDTTRRYERQRADIDGMSISGAGGLRTVGGSAWITVLQESQFVRIRVEFRNGVVVAVEEPAAESESAP